MNTEKKPTMPTINSSSTTPQDFCNQHNACRAGERFATQYQTMFEVWENCHRVDWLLWILDKTKQTPDQTTLRLFAVWAVRETPLGDGRKVFDLLTDERIRRAVEAAENFAHGRITREELREARHHANAANAAYAAAAAAAAYAAAYAAYAAAAYAAAYAAYAVVAAAKRGSSREEAQRFQATYFKTLMPNPFSNVLANNNTVTAA